MNVPQLPRRLTLLLTLLLPLVLGLTHQEDDIVFDDIGEEMTSVSPVVNRKEHETLMVRRRTETRKKDRVERLWGVPDASVSVGHVLKVRIPNQAFGGSIDHYEVVGKNGNGLPQWIHWDEAAWTFLGVPTKKDVGKHELTVKAYGKHEDVAEASFVVYVKREKLDELKHKDGKTHCKKGEEQTLIMIILDSKFDDLKPVARVEAIENLAGFLELHTSALSIHPASEKEVESSAGTKLTGPGNIRHRKEKHSTSIQWQIGCEGRIWSHQAHLVKQLRDEARDGTLAEVIQLPVLLWRVKREASSGTLLRYRREIGGSGDYRNNEDNDEENDEYEYDDNDYGESYDDGEREDDEDNEPITEIPPRSASTASTASKASKTTETPAAEHAHRHHHGEESIGWKPMEEIDEEEIIPMVNQWLGNGLDGSSTISVNRPTTTSQTSTTSPSSSSSSSSTIITTTITTPESSAPSSTSMTITRERPVSKLINQSITPSATSQVPITSSDTMTTTTTTTAATTMMMTTPSTSSERSIAPMTIFTTMETTRSEMIDEPVNGRNFIDTEYDKPSSLTTSYPIENITGSSSSSSSSSTLFVTTTSPTMTNLIRVPTTVITSEKTESNSTYAVYVNVTEQEPTETTEMPMTSPNTSTTVGPSTVIVYTTTTTTSTEMPDIIVTTTRTTTTEAPVTETIPVKVASTTTTATTTTTTTTTTEPATTPTTTRTTTTTTRASGREKSIITSTEKIEYGVRNFPPRQDRRLKKIPVTAGKPLSYVIPADTFSDVEDGDTRKLRLSLYLQGSPVKTTHWLQLDPQSQQVYGLPLENDVSKWDHDLVASDSEGLNVTERLDIYVQQHKLSRSVNHEFSIYVRIDKRTAFPKNVDWQLKIVQSLGELYGDDDASQITVRLIDITQDQAIFTWTNDSIPRSSECPKDEINKLLNVLIADKDGEPSTMLINALGPEIRVKRVVYQGIGQCEEMKRPKVLKIPTQQEPKNNFAPIPRNQVDHINATVGQLLVYKVPDDTFYDPEDGSAYNMEMSLLTNERAPIPYDNWLQFDMKNREFYGVPLAQDVGRKEYQLIVTDKQGASATDGMVVIVQPAPIMRHSVEFSMTLAIPYESFAHSAMEKKTFIERIRDLFNDRDTSAISLDSITEGSTVVTWRNITLPTSHCPNEEISRLSEILVKPDKSLTDRIDKIMGDEFPVKQITLTPMGMCLGQLTGLYSPDSHGLPPPSPPLLPPRQRPPGAAGGASPSEDSTSVGSSTDDYLITFVLPAIIIAAMLILAGIIACVLYRRRRSGKMSISEQDDERQSFRSKGIPVIFQDELDEKPDPGNKSPVILKEEKPPLPPPEYQKAEDDGADVPMLSQENSEEPYQPPPPFATNRDNNRQNRPKPTPTYRKPPPYVPP